MIARAIRKLRDNATARWSTLLSIPPALIALGDLIAGLGHFLECLLAGEINLESLQAGVESLGQRWEALAVAVALLLGKAPGEKTKAQRLAAAPPDKRPPGDYYGAGLVALLAAPVVLLSAGCNSATVDAIRAPVAEWRAENVFTFGIAFRDGKLALEFGTRKRAPAAGALPEYPSAK